jgi:putative NADPH-quinone reductase
MDEFERGSGPDGLKEAAATEHIFVFPLWLGTMPALLKAFLEQVMRPGADLLIRGEPPALTRRFSSDVWRGSL